MQSEAVRVLTLALERFGSLVLRDKKYIDQIKHRYSVYRAKRDVFRIGDVRGETYVVVSGLFCRYSLLEDGGRQIVAVLVPGDMCDTSVWADHPYDFSVGALSQGSLAVFPRATLRMFYQRPALARAFSLARHVDDATSREWLVNIGKRAVEDRLLRLLNELTWRMENAGLVGGNTLTLPLMQNDLADALGITHIHVNRTLKQLEAQGLVTLGRGRILVRDIAALRQAVGTYPAYLGSPTHRVPAVPALEATSSSLVTVALAS